MAYRYEKQPNGEYDLIIDGWQNGIADSPYLGITSMKNLNIQYLPGAVYSNFARTADFTDGSPYTIGFPTYWTASSPDVVGTVNYYMIDSDGIVWTSSGGGWTELSSVGTGGTGNGIVAFTDSGGTAWLLAFSATEILYYTGSGWNAVINATGLTSGNHYAIWSQNTNTIWFCNGNQIGSIVLKTGSTFDPSTGDNYTVTLDAFSLPYYETSTWLTEFGALLMIAAGSKIYPWDQQSAFYNAPLSIKEQIIKMINVQNILYILAGFRGNVYMSNGYSISLFKKIPDSFFTLSATGSLPTISPTIWWGDVMCYANKLYMGASGFYVDGTLYPVVSGIFSIGLGVNVTGTIEVAGALNFENQNSYGLTNNLDSAWNSSPLNGLGTPNCLINQNTTSGLSYFSCWYNGTTSQGGIDTTSATPCVNSETVIESDLIPIGTFRNQKTFSSVEFKLDTPMTVSGQAITIYGRQHLSDDYVQIGTTTSGLSGIYTQIPFQNWQWLQFMIVLNSATTGGVNYFTRLREVRIR